MKNFRISGRLRLARIKIKRPFRFIAKHPYVYGTILFVFIVAIAAKFPSVERNSSSNVNSISTQYKKGSIAELDAARAKAAEEGEELKVINLTKKAPVILEQVPVK